MTKQKWRVIQPSNQNNRPFMARWLFEADRYEIEVTDLAHIWAECLEKKEIISRAHDSACSIDPAEDSSQIGILLEKVKNTLKGADGTKIALDLSSSADCVTLVCDSPLPKPLNSLQWSIYLHRLPNEAVTSELVLPLMYESYLRQAKVEGLGQALHEKDNAINKLADKIESTGIELASLFRTTGGHKSTRKPARKDLFKQIPGLQAFDQATWENEWTASGGSSGFGQVAESAFPSTSQANVQTLLEQLRFGYAAVSEGRSTTRENVLQQLHSTEPDGQTGGFQTHDNASFSHQRLTSDPRKKDVGEKEKEAVAQPTSTNEILDDDTTEDEDSHVLPAQGSNTNNKDSTRSMSELDDPNTSPADPMKIQHQRPQPQSTTPTRKLGLIGGARISKTGLSTASHGPTDGSADENQPLFANANQAQRTRKLGIIGGRKTNRNDDDHEKNTRQNPAAQTEASSNLADSTSPDTSVNPAKPPSDPKRNLDEDTPEDAVKVPPSFEEEDVQERADRKRLELKRDLEQGKTKTASKKKRKF